MNSKRKIKRMFSAMDDIALPSAEKMLPPEALVERSNAVRRERKQFPKFAAVGFAAIALVLAGALVVGSVAVGCGNKQAPDGDVVLKNDISAPSYDDTTVDESKVALEDMPIISCGKYSGCSTNVGVGSTSLYRRLPGEVYFFEMFGIDEINMDEYLTRDDALYAVRFGVDIYYSNAYQQAYEESLQLKQDYLRAKRSEFLESFLADVISKYGKEGFITIYNLVFDCFSRDDIDPCTKLFSLAANFDSDFSKASFNSFIASFDSLIINGDVCYSELFSKALGLTYDVFYDFMVGGICAYERCVFDLHKLSKSMIEHNEWYEGLRHEFATISEEAENIWLENKRSSVEAIEANAKTDMYEYLESLNVQFYEKTVCYTNEAGEVVSSHKSRVAFLTKEQIKSLQAGEDYALIITLVCEELAKMENDTVYLKEPDFVVFNCD